MPRKKSFENKSGKHAILSSIKANLSKQINTSEALSVCDFVYQILGFKDTLFTSQTAILKCLANEELNHEEKLLLAQWADEGKTNWVPERTRWFEVNVEVGMRCLGGDTKIFTNRHGLVPLKDLIEVKDQQYTKWLDEDLQVYTRHGMKRIEGIQSKPAESCLQVTTKAGYQITASGEHPFLVLNHQGDYVFKQLKDLKIGDSLVIDRTPRGNYRRDTQKNDAEIGRFLGYLTGDGYVKLDNRMSLTSIDQELIDDFSNITASLFNGYQVKKQTYSQDTRVPSYNIYGLKNRRIAASWGLSYNLAHEKEVPSYVMAGSKECVRNFLRALFDTDGGVEDRGQTVSLCSTSNILIQQVQELLLEFGIVSTIRSKKTTHRDAYTLTISSHDADAYMQEIGFGLSRKAQAFKRPLHRTNFRDIVPNGISLLKSIHNKLPRTKQGHVLKRGLFSWKELGLRNCKNVTTTVLDKAIEFLTHFPEVKEDLEKLKAIRSKNYFHSPIKKLEEKFEPLYDICVEDVHEFVANGVCTHNSGKTMLASLIATYQFYKLLLKEDPLEGFKRAGTGTTIFITTIATTQDQSKDTVFGYMKNYVMGSAWFKSLIEKNEVVVTQERIYAPNKNIVILAGHSNAGALVGKGAVLVVFDELCRFIETTGSKEKVDGLVTSVDKSLTTFAEESRKISVSSVWAEGDYMQHVVQNGWELAEQGVLCFHLSTFDMRPDITREDEDIALRYTLDPIAARRDYDSIRPAAMAAFFDPLEIDFAKEEIGCPQKVDWYPGKYTDLVGNEYVSVQLMDTEFLEWPNFSYAHLDPAINGDSYSLCIGHLDEAHGLVVIDALIAWKPEKKGIEQIKVGFENVEQVIFELAKKRNITNITFDHFQGEGLVQKLCMEGHHASVIPFTNARQVEMYQIAKRFINNHRVRLPRSGPLADQLVEELKHIEFNGTKLLHPAHIGKDLADSAVVVISKLARLIEREQGVLTEATGISTFTARPPSSLEKLQQTGVRSITRHYKGRMGGADIMKGFYASGGTMPKNRYIFRRGGKGNGNGQ